MTLAGARRAYLVYLGQEAAGSFWFMMVITASGLFMIQDAHLYALQLVLVGTTLELAALGVHARRIRGLNRGVYSKLITRPGTGAPVRRRPL